MRNAADVCNYVISLVVRANESQNSFGGVLIFSMSDHELSRNSLLPTDTWISTSELLEGSVLTPLPFYHPYFQLYPHHFFCIMEKQKCPLGGWGNDPPKECCVSKLVGFICTRFVPHCTNLSMNCTPSLSTFRSIWQEHPCAIYLALKVTQKSISHITSRTCFFGRNIENSSKSKIVYIFSLFL